MKHLASGGYLMVLAALSLVLATACGVKTPPYPEAATLPDKVVNLTQTITDQGEVILSWRPPKTNMVGRPLTSLGGFAIEMAENIADEKYCLTCPHQYETIDKVAALSPPPGLDLAPGPYTWRYKMKVNRVYHFRVKGLSSGGGSHPQAYSETVVWSVPSPGALPGFSVAMADKAVNIGWGRSGAGYRAEVERRLPDSEEWKALKDFDPQAGRYTDFDVEYEKTYIYRGRLAKLKEDSSIPGPWSREITVRVIDVTPPNPPGYVDAALTPKGVSLKWESQSFDPDLAGYRVYRRLSGEENFTLLNSSLLKKNEFFDPVTPQPGASVRYQVTSVDGSPRANESLPSPDVDVYLDEVSLEAPERPQ